MQQDERYAIRVAVLAPVEKPTRKGFGSRLIEHGARGDLRGTATINYDPSGVRYVSDIAAPVLI